MDLSHPLAVVTPTLDAAVLHALSSSTGWSSGAQVHRLGGSGSPDGVRRVLGRLVEQGIVLARHHPPSILYTLNREHVAAPHIIALSLLRAAVIDRISEAVAKAPEPVLHASLFGSFARGEATATSDIDLLVAVEEEGDPPAWLDELATGIRRWTGNAAHVVVVSPRKLQVMIAEDDPLVASWHVDHVHLIGMRLDELLRRST